MLLVGPVLDPAETAYAQVAARGFSPADVTDIVLTHLDPDHSGGLADFPHATVHVGRVEHDAAMHPVLREKLRYLPAHWSHGPHWQVHDPGGESWEGFESVKVLGDDSCSSPCRPHPRPLRRGRPHGRRLAAARRRRVLPPPRPLADTAYAARTDRLPTRPVDGPPARLENLERLRELERASGTHHRLLRPRPRRSSTGWPATDGSPGNDRSSPARSARCRRPVIEGWKK